MAILWKTIFEAELAKLRNGNSKPGEVFATVQSMATEHNVSEITARRVLSELAKTGVVKNVPRRGSVVSDKNFPAKVFLLSPEKLIIPEFALAVSKNLKGIFEEAIHAGIEILPVSLDFVLHYNEKAPAFVLYNYSSNKLGTEIFLPMLPEPLIPIGINAPEKPERGIAIGSDSRAMMEALVKHMIASGRTRISYAGATAAPWFQSRFDGYISTLKENNLEFRLDWLMASDEDLNGITPERVLKDRGAEKFDAVCCAGLNSGRRMLEFLLKSGISVPGDVAVGAIGEIPSSIPGIPRLTMVNPDYVEQGREAIRQMLRLSLDVPVKPRFFTAPFKLIAGETTAAPTKEDAV